MEVPPVIDGVVSEGEWASAATARSALVLISTGNESGETGQYWIGYDEKYIYVASRITLQDPEGVRADEYRENVSLAGNDSFTFTVDPFGQGRSQNTFSFNANGATRTYIAGGRANKREWGGRFESAGRITETGWEGEARIAWEIMSLPSAGVRDVRFLVWWSVPSTQQTLSDIFYSGDPSQMHTLTGVEIPASSRRSPISLLPYAYGGIGEDGRHIANAGLDLKASFAEKATLVATFSPDFRNIENSILSLDFSNFERLASETRPFFLEGRQYLGPALFASQRIDTFDAGVKFYGDLDEKTRFGVLSTVDFGADHTFVGSARYSPDLNTSLFGNIVTLDREGEDNVAGNVFASRRFGDYLFNGGLQLTDDEVAGAGESLTLSVRNSTPGLFLFGSYFAVSPTYRTRLGFSPRTDIRGPFISAVSSHFYTEGPITMTSVGGTASDYDTYSGGHFQETLSTFASVGFRSGLTFGAASTFDHFLDRHDHLYRVSASMPSFDPFRAWSISHSWGNLVDEQYSSTSISVRNRPVKRLQLRLSYQAVEHFAYRDQTIFNFSWEMSEYESVGGRAVQQGDRWNWFASYRMSGNVGTEYFLIVGDPNASTFQRTLILKISVPLTIGG